MSTEADDIERELSRLRKRADERTDEIIELKARIEKLEAVAEVKAWQEIEDWAMSNGFVLIAERAKYIKNSKTAY
jgi:flagellar motility protein MotE (MotC chaperone)